MASKPAPAKSAPATHSARIKEGVNGMELAARIDLLPRGKVFHEASERFNAGERSAELVKLVEDNLPQRA